jgi:hypothetical protein
MFLKSLQSIQSFQSHCVRGFEEEESRRRLQRQQLKCEITGKTKRPGSFDCTCNGVCMVKKSETHLIHYEGGVGIVPKK